MTITDLARSMPRSADVVLTGPRPEVLAELAVYRRNKQIIRCGNLRHLTSDTVTLTVRIRPLPANRPSESLGTRHRPTKPASRPATTQRVTARRLGIAAVIAVPIAIAVTVYLIAHAALAHIAPTTADTPWPGIIAATIVIALIARTFAKAGARTRRCPGHHCSGCRHH